MTCDGRAAGGRDRVMLVDCLWILRLLPGLIFVLPASLFPVGAQTPSSSIYADTTWTAFFQKSPSVVFFAPDGTWTDDFQKGRKVGTWAASSDALEVVLTSPSEGKAKHFELLADNSLFWVENYLIYRCAPPLKSKMNLGTIPEPAISYVGTKWTNLDNGLSSVVFGADGKWTEDWKGNHEDGVWQAYKNTKGVVVTRGDGNVLYYLLNDDKNLIRQDDSYVYICETLTSPENAHNPVVASRATSAYAGSTWTGTYQDHETTMRFEPNGKFITEWKTIHLEGNWRPDKDDKKVMVYRDDGVVLHLELTDAKNLHWVEGNLDYQFAASRSSRHGAPFGAPQPPGAPNPFGTPDAPGASNPFGTVAPPPAPAPPAEIVKLTAAQARAVVLITGDNAEGTGFLVKMKGQPFVLTNIHVISNNPNLKITTSTGAPITILSCAGANDRDLAMITIKDAGFSYLELATDISDTLQPGDEVMTPGNSEGGEVMLNTGGKVLGIGPQRVEIDNPIYHGNSGGPVFHVKSGKVIGVVTEAMKVDVTDELDKDSFANRNSAIGHAMRYFGLRLDNVEHWENYDTEQFANETAFLDQFDKRSSALDAYLNAPDDDKPEDTIWQKDTTIMKANTNYFDLASGAADASQKMDATRTLYGELGDVADAGMSAIQNLTNFYSFDQQRAKDEIAYRKALKAELDTIGKNVSKLGSLPRSNQ